MTIDFKGPHKRALNKLQNAMVAEVMSNIPPPNAPSTIAQKHSSHTLIDSGEMLGHITYKQTEEEGLLHGEVGLFEEELAKRGAINEYGSGDGHIPARPWQRPAIDKSQDKIASEMAAEIFDQISKEFGGAD
jgi:hypothetical protein